MKTIVNGNYMEDAPVGTSVSYHDLVLMALDKQPTVRVALAMAGRTPRDEEFRTMRPGEARSGAGPVVLHAKVSFD